MTDHFDDDNAKPIVGKKSSSFTQKEQDLIMELLKTQIDLVKKKNKEKNDKIESKKAKARLKKEKKNAKKN